VSGREFQKICARPQNFSGLREGTKPPSRFFFAPWGLGVVALKNHFSASTQMGTVMAPRSQRRRRDMFVESPTP
jgi:hypothetical protein